MLCEIAEWEVFGNVLTTYLILLATTVSFTLCMSSILFLAFYVKPTYEWWRWKSDPRFPEPLMVRNEIIQMIKGSGAAVICPVASLYLTRLGYSSAYCGSGGYGLGYHVFQFVFIWIASDFFEFYYHRLGHITKIGWSQHKYHHHFYNPTPFAVVADEYMDQLVRAAPLVVFPMIMPTNIDLMIFEFLVFFYGYGLFLHWGFELNYPDAHHPWINAAFQHHLHHKISIKNRPLHTGFFFKIWDQMFGSVYTDDCFCAKCAQKKGERTPEQFAQIKKPDYSILLKPKFWANSFSATKIAMKDKN